MSALAGMALVVGAMFVVMLLQHGGERVVNAQPRKRVLPALGCHILLTLGMFAALGLLLVWLMMTGVL